MAAPLRLAAAACSSKLIRFQRLFPPAVVQRVNYSSETAVNESEELQYPPIPPPKDSREELIRIASEPVLAAETPAEMLYALTKKYTWNYKIHPYGYHNGFIDFYKYVTKTEVVDGLPDQMQSWINSEHVEKHTSHVTDLAHNIILTDQAVTYRHKQDIIYRDRDVGRQLCKNLMNAIIAYLSPSSPHLEDADVDFDVEMKSFWPRGSHKFYQYLGEPLVTIRTKEPLREFIEENSELCHGSVPDWPYDPNIVSVFKQCGNAVCFPGFKHGGGHLNAHTQLYVSDIKRQSLEGSNLLQEVHQGHGVSSSFAWLNALALYQKYCCYNDIPRPMSCQTIVSTGQFFSFYCYQLNTMTLDDLVGEGNDLRNVCWQAVDIPLFSSVEENKVQDFNEEVLKLMVAFLSNPTTAGE